jgi:hypothetical protein
MKKYGEMNINKYREMNSSRLTKSVNVMRREGLLIFSYRFGKYLKRRILGALTPLAILAIPKATFMYRGEKLPYFLHRKSLTWTNERAIEIPIAVHHIKNMKKRRILEVGAVLPHYYPTIKKDVVDKFEKGDGIMNIDVLDFRPKLKYDLIVSISTLEHVGFDDDVKDAGGTLKAIKNLKINCLKNGGIMVITLPIDYNKNVDKQLCAGQLKFDEEHYYIKKNRFNRWKETDKNKAMKVKYGSENARSIIVGIIKK